ncbi:hypothetical protein MTBSS4_40225 [Magnetospirillum sp. SS-4]|nr:hypothetical protein MTBSS4_40225 [Magnetospirillum sp. SS-4]
MFPPDDYAKDDVFKTAFGRNIVPRRALWSQDIDATNGIHPVATRFPITLLPIDGTFNLALTACRRRPGALLSSLPRQDR